MVTAVVAVLLALSGLHVYWALGGRRGVAVAVPTSPNGAQLFRPSILATLMVACALGLAALLVLAAHGVLRAPVPEVLLIVGERALACVFLLRALGEFRYVGLFRRVRATPFARWDAWLFTPLCLLLGVVVWTLPR
ncbi:DUF3995 domain-containing protein [Deinococcus maricopensis]|uniref:DUF3995 domain-containing protein n=1 Tax=Deinococcus maricopensis (strain DSM 21211 / LMG 22137 / NRRL B-23946 / LB-34) TaxID=709986 RepID=E8UAP3_DEIML|nr:DUF3995 domain-containing protein [Deinococcus maricopensis]ADV68132.1 hypothetical protein Deima_2497 [Deinococcus maricopensis DSM 21211]